MRNAIRVPLLVSLFVLPGSAASGQHVHPPQPYAGEQDREIKALSPEEVDGLRAGAGLGFALAAELNGYPGPRHVLDLAVELGLSATQHARVQHVFDEMQEHARRLGAQVVEHERRLDERFRAGQVTAETIAAATSEIGRLRGQLRAVHLEAHVALMNVLTPDQIRQYQALRGYTGRGHRHSRVGPRR